MANVKDLKTVGGMQSFLAKQPYAGLAMTIAEAINSVRAKRDLTDNAELSSQVLEEIRQGIYDTSDPNRGGDINPFMMLFNAMNSKTGNATEEALQFIEGLQQQLRS